MLTTTDEPSDQYLTMSSTCRRSGVGVMFVAVKSYRPAEMPGITLSNDTFLILILSPIFFPSSCAISTL